VERFASVQERPPLFMGTDDPADFKKALAGAALIWLNGRVSVRISALFLVARIVWQKRENIDGLDFIRN
jgi:hypothetical protein